MIISRDTNNDTNDKQQPQMTCFCQNTTLLMPLKAFLATLLTTS